MSFPSHIKSESETPSQQDENGKITHFKVTTGLSRPCHSIGPKPSPCEIGFATKQAQVVYVSSGLLGSSWELPDVWKVDPPLVCASSPLYDKDGRVTGLQYDPMT